MTTHAASSRRSNARRLALGGGLGLVLLYALFVLTGYLWVRYALRNERISLAEVALFRWKAQKEVTIHKCSNDNASQRRVAPVRDYDGQQGLRHSVLGIECGPGWRAHGHLRHA